MTHMRLECQGSDPRLSFVITVFLISFVSQVRKVHLVGFELGVLVA